MLPVAAGAFIGGAYAFYYKGTYDPPASPDIGQQQITLPTPQFQRFDEALPRRQGVFLLDRAHFNRFSEDELSPLLARMSETGYTMDVLERQALLDDKLRRADVFAVIVPGRGYAEAEVELVKEFMAKGGRLLLVGEPTRRHDLNSLSEAFGMVFRKDFLYNVVEHEGNYRNVFIRDFISDAPRHPVTEGLDKITLYTASSIKTSGLPLALTDENTYSSQIERVERFSPLVQTIDGGVIGVSDLTFFTSPQNAVSDNDRLIANLVRYLTAGQRTRDLADFPHFFKAEVDILLTNPELFTVGTDLKGVLEAFEVQAEVRPIENLTRDTVFLGLYQESDTVAHHLNAGGVRVADGTLRTPFTADIEAQGTAIVLLQQDPDRNVLVVLGSSQGVVRVIVRQLATGEFRGGLVGDFLGVYRLF